MTSPTEKPETKTKIFFHCRLAESFDSLNSSLAQLTGELWSCKVAWK